ncbi:hypothetical protein MED121_22602 [Marinomonas sp. MED121]|uniref:hypothetical protein n=1 Tax=Marinomonas sp. MED121 TaxID=314277 RepID=UPI000068FDAE|nr:hypothetical protein [Marinomonas sp. MED121]EAQ65510.1 hypothetical protein MED121_22602 [Marinomonas sp. MED121]
MKLILVFLSFFVPFTAFAAKDVAISKVEFVYQLDSDSTVFEFKSNVTHSCGGSVYKVKSPNDGVANRKFTMVLTAFVANKNLAFHDTGVCDGSRSIAAWVRITH